MPEPYYQPVTSRINDSLGHTNNLRSNYQRHEPRSRILYGVNRSTLVGLLLPYHIEAKEHGSDLLDMSLQSPALNSDFI